MGQSNQEKAEKFINELKSLMKKHSVKITSREEYGTDDNDNEVFLHDVYEFDIDGWKISLSELEQ